MGTIKGLNMHSDILVTLAQTCEIYFADKQVMEEGKIFACVRIGSFLLCQSFHGLNKMGWGRSMIKDNIMNNLKFKSM